MIQPWPNEGCLYVVPHVVYPAYDRNAPTLTWHGERADGWIIVDTDGDSLSPRPIFPSARAARAEAERQHPEITAWSKETNRSHRRPMFIAVTA